MYTENQGTSIFMAGVVVGLGFAVFWYFAHQSRKTRWRLIEEARKRKESKNDLDYGDPGRVDFQTTSTAELVAMTSARRGSVWQDRIAEFQSMVELHAIRGYVMIQGEIVKPSTIMMSEQAIQAFEYGETLGPEVEIIGKVLWDSDRVFKISELGHITAPPAWVNTWLDYQQLQYDLAWIYELMTEIETDPTQVCSVPYRMTLVDRKMRMVVKVFDDDDWITLGWTGPVLVLQEFTVAGVVPNGPIIPLVDRYLEIHDNVKKLAEEVPAEYLSNTEILNNIEYLEKTLVKR